MFVSVPRSLALLACIACLPAVADEPRYNQISLRAEASSEVAQDLMHVTLYTESQHEDPAQLAARTTEAMNKALQQARQAKNVRVNQGSRSSYPVYEEKGQQITAWRERAELRLESSDFTSLSKLTAALMQDLKMGGMSFSVSDPIRQQNEDALLKDAVTAFRARAQLATEALGGRDYKIVSLNLNSGGGYQPEMRSVAMKHMDAMPTPDIEAGTRQISISADGVIEVQMP
ncbi:SIMPL domain-containing protein [Pseudomonas sp. PS1]|uniref:SIMPL domain-containing protein n=1 Tax=Stutzerimonas marianensis TaxID=2929513 RepID=A0A9X1W6R3_9GAMM|nr:SIMPL domain-containing protein [Pseudomonas marianensis]MCJ0975613.1 SIMPL domain-containing protein [Pseudomonas marianensis]